MFGTEQRHQINRIGGDQGVAQMNLGTVYFNHRVLVGDQSDPRSREHSEVRIGEDLRASLNRYGWDRRRRRLRG